jgi:hypothetical protein
MNAQRSSLCRVYQAGVAWLVAATIRRPSAASRSYVNDPDAASDNSHIMVSPASTCSCNGCTRGVALLELKASKDDLRKQEE